MLLYGLSISGVSNLTGIHWDTIKRIHINVMEDALETRIKQLKARGYKPEYLAVDEFAIHKGQTYATCVMDLTEGMFYGSVKAGIWNACLFIHVMHLI